MLYVNRLRLNHGLLKDGKRYRITETPHLCISWGAASDGRNVWQTACRLRVWGDDAFAWDSGWTTTLEQALDYAGPPLPVERRICFSVTIQDNRGETSEPAEDYFYHSGLPDHDLRWIAAPVDKPGQAVYFRRNFRLDGQVKHATLYACGLGYHELTLNGESLDDARLDPAHANYARSLYYVMLPELEQKLQSGENCLGVVLGEGWRRNDGPYLKHVKDREIEFFGVPQLSVLLSLEYADGRRETIGADESWQCGGGAIVCNHLFNGETTDARQAIPDWNRLGTPPESFRPARSVPAPGGWPAVMILEPIREQEIYPARTVTPLKEGVQVVDFGQNIAGVCRLRLPKGMQSGQTITIDHMEFLDEDGSLSLDTPGILMSTGYYYYNAILLAKVLREDLVQRNYRFTTGNLCTRYLMDMLAEYGYIDDAWTLITREEYPSFGHMLQQEGTTVWERFELKKNPGMNSHCHPMYGAGVTGSMPVSPGSGRRLPDFRQWLSGPVSLLACSRPRPRWTRSGETWPCAGSNDMVDFIYM